MTLYDYTKSQILSHTEDFRKNLYWISTQYSKLHIFSAANQFFFVIASTAPHGYCIQTPTVNTTQLSLSNPMRIIGCAVNGVVEGKHCLCFLKNTKFMHIHSNIYICQ